MTIKQRHKFAIRGFLFFQLFLGSKCLGQQFPSAEVLLKDLACSACHSGVEVETDIDVKAPDLTQVGLRLNPDFLFSFLQNPIKIRQQIGHSRMPNFHLDESEALALTLFLREQIPPETELPDFTEQENFMRAISEYPDVSAKIGQEIFVAQNCAACHRLGTLASSKNGPDLGSEGLRVKEKWLRDYLRNPRSVRPFGYLPGSGSRHPDFRLSASEADTLTAYLIRLRRGFGIDQSLPSKELSPFSRSKALTLLRQKLPCLGCHSLGDDGGKIGPDLSSISRRLQPDFVYQIVKDPQSVIPGTVMPRIEMPQKTLNLITNYLVQQDLVRHDSSYLSLIENQPLFSPLEKESLAPYMKYCAPCHGRDGNGDGYNARFLPVKPTQHADASAMSVRPDDTLFDGIFAGGDILNKSHRMPAWGFTLEREVIWRLVDTIRSLCDCEGPAWSR